MDLTTKESLESFFDDLDQQQCLNWDGPMALEDASYLRIECVVLDARKTDVVRHTSHVIKGQDHVKGQVQGSVLPFVRHYKETNHARFMEARLFCIPAGFPHLTAVLQTSATQLALKYSSNISLCQPWTLPPCLPVFHSSTTLFLLFRLLAPADSSLNLASASSASCTHKTKEKRRHAHTHRRLPI